MALEDNGDPRNSVLGEFMVALVRAPEPIKEAIIQYGISKMLPFEGTLLNPYPMLRHMKEIVIKNAILSSGPGADEGTRNKK